MNIKGDEKSPSHQQTYPTRNIEEVFQAEGTWQTEIWIYTKKKKNTTW